MPNYTLNLTTSKTPSNSTAAAKDVPPYLVVSQPYWIMTFMADSVIVLCNLWITVAFVTHSRNVLARHRIDEHNRRVYKLLMAAVTVPFTRYFCTIALLVVMTDPTDNACEIAIDMGKSFFIVSTVAIYMFYWTRQRSFYQNTALSHTVCRQVRVVSKFSLFQLLTLAFLMIPLAVYPSEYEAYPGGCIAKDGHVTKNGRYYVYAIVLLMAQVTVLALFSYPLVQHYKAQRRRKRDSNLPDVPTESRLDALEEQNRTLFISTEGIDNEKNCCGASSDCEIQEIDAGKTGKASSDCEIQQIEAEQTCIASPYCEIQVTDADRPATLRETRVRIDSAPRSEDHSFPATPKLYSGETSPAPVLRIGRTVKKIPATLFKRLSSMENNDKMYVIIKRTFKLSALAVFSDMVTLLVAGDMLPEDTPQCVVRVVYDIDLFINVIAVIAGFEDWRQILKTPADRIIRMNAE